MRPKALLKLALPLAVGVEGRAELAEFELARKAGPEFSSRLAESLPEHMRLTSLESYETRRSLAARVIGASYEIVMRSESGDPISVEKIEEAADAFRRSEELLLEEKRKGRSRKVDVKEYVERVLVEEASEALCALSFRATVSPGGSIRPERVVEALEGLSGIRFKIDRMSRTRIHLDEVEA
jgi:radical SAM-linked protein